MNKPEFAERVRACERRLYRVARTMLSCDADCEDAVQEALLKAWAKRDALREEAYFETWLMRILINECHTLGRRAGAAAQALTEDIAAPPEGRDASLMEALLALPEKPRVALELNCIEGYKVREIARMLGVSQSAVKWRLSRGRELLRKELGEEARV